MCGWVGGTDRAAQHGLLEEDVIRDDRGRQVVLHFFKGGKDEGEVGGLVGGIYVEGTEDLGGC